MNKSDMLEQMVKATGLSASDVGAVMNALEEIVTQEAKGGKVTVPGFLVFGRA